MLQNAVTITLSSFLLFALAAPCSAQTFGEGDERPNILLLVADDLGYGDVGNYGGDIETPNIDELAARGLRFTQFRTAPMCAPTRAMLLSGNNNHVAGMGRQGTSMAEHPGYEGHLSDRIVPLPVLLRDAGYHTYTVGKWHLGTDAEHSPAAKGFERSFNLLQGASNHFNSIGLEAADSVSLYREDGELVEYPEGRYSTEFYTSKLIEYINQGREDGRPFFAFAAFTSPHWPLQAPKEFQAKYRGRYDMGYDELRLQRFASMQEAGVIPADAELPPRLYFITPWNELSTEQKKIESRKMELYAAMVDNLDFHIGRIVDFLRATGLLDNTLILFMSDNGAAANDFFVTDPFGPFLRTKYDNSYENMGSPTSFVSYGPQWAHAGAAAFNRYKGFATEGGTAAPLIVAGPGISHRGRITDAFTTAMDLAPTFLEIAGVEYPGAHASPAVQPMHGESMLPLLVDKADRVHGEDYVVALEHWHRAFVRRGDWKLVTHDLTEGEDSFELFNVATDLGETTDLRDRHPDKYGELIEEWALFREEAGVIVVDDD